MDMMDYMIGDSSSPVRDTAEQILSLYREWHLYGWVKVVL
jgi:hypothetical protein